MNDGVIRWFSLTWELAWVSWLVDGRKWELSAKPGRGDDNWACEPGVQTMRVYTSVAFLLMLPICLGCSEKGYGHGGPHQNGAVMIEMDVGEIDFRPPHVRGDRDFKAHGPLVTFRAEVGVDGHSGALAVRVYMRAEEWEDGKPEPDHTTVEGWTPWQQVKAPAGLRIVGLAEGQPPRFEYSYLDKNHEPDVFEFPPQALVASLVFIGDTPGEEAGSKTGVRVRFHRVRVTAVPD
jgi:hypothetical protein